jgi:hypothetical protein
MAMVIEITRNWLRVIGCATVPHIDQGVGYQPHSVVLTLDMHTPTAAMVETQRPFALVNASRNAQPRIEFRVQALYPDMEVEELAEMA